MRGRLYNALINTVSAISELLPWWDSDLLKGEHSSGIKSGLYSLRNKTLRLLDGISITSRSFKPRFSASATTSSRLRTPQLGSRLRRLASKFLFKGIREVYPKACIDYTSIPIGFDAGPPNFVWTVREEHAAALQFLFCLLHQALSGLPW